MQALQIHSGACACLLYYGGPLCEIPLFPACRLTEELSHDGAPPLMSCRPWDYPRACACVAQCKTAPTVQTISVWPRSGQPASLGEPPAFACYHRGGPSDPQLSTLPAEGEAGVTYYSSQAMLPSQSIDRDAMMKSHFGQDWRKSRHQVPNALCPGTLQDINHSHRKL